MDEPFGKLDAQTKERMQRDLLKLWRMTRKTVIFVTRDLERGDFSFRPDYLSARTRDQIHHIEEVAFARPRGDEMRLSPEFLDIKRKLWKMLEH